MLPLLLVACLHTPEPIVPQPAVFDLPTGETGEWPRLDAKLRPIEPVFPADFGVHRIAVDPGHGLSGNQGAQNVMCGLEQEHNLAMANLLTRALRDTGHFEVKQLRTDHNGPSYRSRIASAESFEAEALISIHADSRGDLSQWSPDGIHQCYRNDNQPGFAVLVFDGGESKGRLALARASATRLTEVGLLAYDGYDYGGLYELDPTPGVFWDRRNLLMLRKPPIPSIIVETHHGLHREEYQRWTEARTHRAFTSAMTAALIDALAPSVAAKSP